MSDHILIRECQLCAKPTQEIFSLGDLPLVDALLPAKDSPYKTYPSPLLYCPSCSLVQLGCLVNPELLFPADYPYTSSTTKVLRDNFKDLYTESQRFIRLNQDDLVIDIGCNDGALLSNFQQHAKTLGITPENMGHIARKKGINVIQSYFTSETTDKIIAEHKKASLITATNVLAHFKYLHKAMADIKRLLRPQGIFISESGYFFSMLEELQYDSIHHEHLRYYTLMSLQHLFNMHGFEIIHARTIPTHGGSIRVYAAAKGDHPANESVAKLLQIERMRQLDMETLHDLGTRVADNKAELRDLLKRLINKGKRITGISAPGRATVLLNYAGISSEMIPSTVETDGSHKIGRFIPGTGILIEEETSLYRNQPDYALMLSWHIAHELMPKIKAQGFKGDFILPLPYVRIIKNKDIY